MRRLCLIPICLLLACQVAQAQGPARDATRVVRTTQSSTITLEEEPDDTGFLKCAAGVLHPDFRHQDNHGALINPLKKAAGTKTAVIAGHGHPGQVCTSNGIDCVLPQQSINVTNQQSWEIWARAWPNQFRSLTILACDTGEGAEGIALLTALADAARVPVRAPTDFIWCGNNEIVLDENATWQEVQPAQKSNLIQAPQLIRFKTRSYPEMTPSTQMQISIDGADHAVSFSNAQLISFAALGAAKPFFVAIEPASIQSLLTKINFRDPLKTSYVPDADVTARFDLLLDVDHRSLRKRFVVLNDRLVNDADDRQLFYRTSSSFTEQLQSLRRR